MDYETVQVQRRGAELRITLNRPEAMNAWNTQLGLDLRDAVEKAGADDEVRAVVITGAGRAFSSGADLKAGFDPTPSGRPDVHTALTQRYHPIYHGDPPDAQARRGRRQRPRGGDRAFARARRRPCDRARERLLPALPSSTSGSVPDAGSSLFCARAGRVHSARPRWRYWASA